MAASAGEHVPPSAGTPQPRPVASATAATASEGPREYTIAQVPVQFPFPAYGSQVSLMAAGIRALTKGQNALLESPTGSGKSLALLCSCLGWQRFERARLIGQFALEQEAAAARQDMDAALAATEAAAAAAREQDEASNGSRRKRKGKAKEAAKRSRPKRRAPSVSQSPIAAETSDSEDDFVKPTPRRRSGKDASGRSSEFFPATSERRAVLDPESMVEDSTMASATSKRDDESQTDIPPPDAPTTSAVQWLQPPSAKARRAKAAKTARSKAATAPKPPKIFFGTRTHRQISQIVSELNRTVYADTQMTILSSREHTCINKKVRKAHSKNEACNSLMEEQARGGKGCFYARNLHHLRESPCLQNTTWDIEDIVAQGTASRACPYYTARELVKRADIVFCPYNYLIDPSIRESLNIDLTGHVVVLDEAHNVEDCARDASSITLSVDSLTAAVDDLDHLIETGELLPDELRPVCAVLTQLRDWLAARQAAGSLRNTGFETSAESLRGSRATSAFAELGLTGATMVLLAKHIQQVNTEIAKQDRPAEAPKPDTMTGVLLSGFVRTFTHFFRCVEDYRIIVSKFPVRKRQSTGSRRRRGPAAAHVRQWCLQLEVACMNPAVEFSVVADLCRSVILTSGTLSPMTSFASELGTPFPVVLEANHVIKPSQMCVQTLSRAISGNEITASFSNSTALGFQDDIGELVLACAARVTGGVLVFVSSYAMLDRLHGRWTTTGLWARLARLKVPVLEPRGSDKAEFEECLEAFYTAVAHGRQGPTGDGTATSREPTGGVLFAVCRGKISEGLDFSDENARLVVTVGLPFPNVKDVKVAMKREFNNEHARQRGLLRGDEWYNIQAFRALNQALGRCIRHKRDWGALLMVDSRFAKMERYVESLSKWVRKGLRHQHSAAEALCCIDEFVRRNVAASAPTPPDTEPPEGAVASTGNSAANRITPSRESEEGFSTLDPLRTDSVPTPAVASASTAPLRSPSPTATGEDTSGSPCGTPDLFPRGTPPSLEEAGPVSRGDPADHTEPPSDFGCAQEASVAAAPPSPPAPFGDARSHGARADPVRPPDDAGHRAPSPLPLPASLPLSAYSQGTADALAALVDMYGADVPGCRECQRPLLRWRGAEPGPHVDRPASQQMESPPALLRRCGCASSASRVLRTHAGGGQDPWDLLALPGQDGAPVGAPNAHFSPEDGICYRPLLCPGCSCVVGVSVLATTTAARDTLGASAEGEVWLFVSS